MKTLLLAALACFASVMAFAQPTIVFDKSIASSRSYYAKDHVTSVRTTADGGAVAGGYYIYSNGGVNETGYFIMKINASGSTIVNNTFGAAPLITTPATTGLFMVVQPTPEGGYIAALTSNSGMNPGYANSNKGGRDIWLVKFDGTGKTKWIKDFGGKGDEDARTIQVTADGYVIAGHTTSDSVAGRATGLHGGSDVWVMKTDTSGAVQWLKTYGGTANETTGSMAATADNGFVISASSQSANGDVSGNKGGYDYWLLKINSNGVLQWQKNFGGSADDICTSARPTLDGGYVMAGYSKSKDADVSFNNGRADFWVVKLNAARTIEWEKNVGNGTDDIANSIIQLPNGCYIVSGTMGGSPNIVELSGLGNRRSWTYYQNGQELAAADTCASGFYAVGNTATTYPDARFFKFLDTFPAPPAQTIKFDTLATVYATAKQVTFSATASSGLGVTFTSSDTTIIKLDSLYHYYFVPQKTGTVQITATQAGNSEYNPAPPVTRTLKIVRQPQHIVPQYGANIKIDMTQDWIQPFYATSYLWVRLTSSDTTVATVAVYGFDLIPKKEGFTDVTAIQPGNDKYEPAAPVTQRLTFIKGKQTINFPVLPVKALGDKDFVAATASSHLPITYIISDTNVAVQVNDSIHIKGLGTATVTATQPGDYRYTAAPAVQQVLVVRQAQTISLDAIGVKNVHDTDFTITATASSGLPVTITINDNSIATYSAASHKIHILRAGVTYIRASQPGNATYAPAVIVSRALTIVHNAGPATQWQKMYGGSGYEYMQGMLLTADSGYIAWGQSPSKNKDVTLNHGKYDIWIIKVDKLGNKLWDKSYGGSQDEGAAQVRKSTDGGYFIAGYTYSNDGDVVGHHDDPKGKVTSDGWLIKIDSTGNIVWQKCVGTANYESFAALQATADGGCVVGSNSFLITKLSSTGAIQWQQTTANVNGCRGIDTTADGGYIAVGTNYNMVGANSSQDILVVKLNAAGAIEWTKGYGGTESDEATDVKTTTDGGFVLAGNTSSSLPGYHGRGDFYILKLSATGLLQWQKILGGSEWEQASAITQSKADGGYLVTGFTQSANGDVYGYHDTTDAWIVKLSKLGEVLWQRAYGGTTYDIGKAVLDLGNNNYVIGGNTRSNNGDFAGVARKGNDDYFIARLAHDTIKSSQAITFPHVPTAQVCDTAFSPATASSGLPVSYTSSNTQVAAILNGKIIIRGPGNVTITAYQNGNQYYNAATPVSDSFTVKPYTSPSVVLSTTDAASAQLGWYTLTADSLVALANISSGATEVITPATQNNEADNIILPFPFYYAGKYFSQISVNRNGVALLTTFSPLEPYFVPSTPSAAPGAMLSLWGRSLSLGANGSVRYKVIGATGARRMVIEWNVTPAGTGNYDRTMQLWLYEGSNKIQFVYGNTAAEPGVTGTTMLVNKSNDYLVADAAGKTTVTSAITVNQWPTRAAFIFTPQQTAVTCNTPNSIKTYYAHTLNTGTGTIYNWKKNGAAVGTNSSLYKDSALTPGDKVWCVLTSACRGQDAVTSDTITLVAPYTPATKIFGNPVMCEGGNQTFSVLVVPVPGTSFYGYKGHWNTGSSTSSGVYISSNAKTGDSVWFTVNYFDACNVTSIASPKIYLTVNKKQAPQVSVTVAPEGAVCNTPLVFTPQGTWGDTLTDRYSWRKNNVQVSLTRVYTDTAPQTGAVITCTRYNITGCVSISSVIKTITEPLVSTTVPVQPSVIQGPPIAVANQPNLLFSIQHAAGSVPQWVVPAGAAITAGQGTDTVTVRWGTVDGHIKVQAVNGCGLSQARGKAVTITTDAQPQTITFAPLTGKTTCDTDFVVPAKTTSELPLTFTSSDTSVATIIAGKVHIKHFGSAVITATQPGSAQYLAAAPVGRTLTVGYNPFTVTIATREKMVSGYTFTIDSAIALADMQSGATNIIAYNNQPPVTPVIDIPFSFYYPAGYFSSFTASANGILRFVNPALTRADYNVMVWSGARYLGLDGNVRYKITGTPGSRRLVVEWNVSMTPNAPYDHTYQAWFYEGTNVIKFVYGKSTNKITVPGGYIGIEGHNTLSDIDYLLYNTVLKTPGAQASEVHYPALGTAFTYTPNNIQQYCPSAAGQTFTAAASAGSVQQWQWKVNGVSVGNNVPSYLSALHNGDSVWVEATSTACPAAPLAISNKIKVSLKKEVVTAVVSTKENPCPGEQLGFRVLISSNKFNIGTVKWYKNGVYMGGGTGFYHNYITGSYHEGDSVWYVVTLNGGNTSCTDSLNITSNKVFIHTRAYVAPAVTVAVIPAGGACTGTPVTFKANFNGVAAGSVQWWKNGAATGYNSTTYIDSTLTTSDSIWYTARGITGCVLSDTAVSNKVAVQVSSAAPPATGVISGPATVSAGQTGITYSVANIPGINYFWQVPAAAIVSGQGTSSITVNWGSAAGNVNVTAQNACGKAAKVTLRVKVAAGLTGSIKTSGGEEGISIQNSALRVMPNPATNMAYVVFNAAGTYKYSLQLTDGTGKVVFTHDGYAVKGENRVAIDVARMAQAMYFVRLNDKQYGTRSAKLVVGR